MLEIKRLLARVLNRVVVEQVKARVQAILGERAELLIDAAFNSSAEKLMRRSIQTTQNVEIFANSRCAHVAADYLHY